MGSCMEFPVIVCLPSSVRPSQDFRSQGIVYFEVGGKRLEPHEQLGTCGLLRDEQFHVAYQGNMPRHPGRGYVSGRSQGRLSGYRVQGEAPGTGSSHFLLRGDPPPPATFALYPFSVLQTFLLEEVRRQITERWSPNRRNDSGWMRDAFRRGVLKFCAECQEVERRAEPRGQELVELAVEVRVMRVVGTVVSPQQVTPTPPGARTPTGSLFKSLLLA